MTTAPETGLPVAPSTTRPMINPSAGAEICDERLCG